MSEQRQPTQAPTSGLAAGLFSAVLAAVIWTLSVTIGVNPALAVSAAFILGIMGINAIVLAAYRWHHDRKLGSTTSRRNTLGTAGLGMVGLVFGSLAMLDAVDEVREAADRSQ